MKASYLQHFRKLLGAENVLTTNLSHFNIDFFKVISGSSSVVLRPKSTSEVVEVLKFCSAERLAVTPQGGNTGMSGGNIPQKGEILLSLGRMTQELTIDENVPAVCVSAGHTLETVIETVKPRNFAFPLDLGSKGTCQIGGNLSTHAGGLRYLRYGSLHSNTLGLEVVLPTGEILSDLCSMRKNNTGYDLKQLFIGAEGTLGVITKANIALFPHPKSVQVAFLGCRDFEAVLKLYSHAKANLNEILSAFEFMDRTSVDLVLRHIPNTRDPLPTSFPYYIIIETHGSNASHDCEKLEEFIATLQGDWGEGVLGRDDKERSQIWKLRELCAVSYPLEGPTFQYDFSIPIPSFETMIVRAKEAVSTLGQVTGVGHLGDANIHVAIIKKDATPLPHSVSDRLYSLVQELKGSISAEHGIGTVKKGELWRSKSPDSLALMVISI